jgi:hypothetical protein
VKILEVIFSFVLSLAGMLLKSRKKGTGRPCDCRPDVDGDRIGEPAAGGDGGDASSDRGCPDAQPGNQSPSVSRLNPDRLLGWGLIVAAGVAKLLG